MRELSFFKRRVMSGYIRGEQIARYLGAKLNPVDNYSQDVCIFIKWSPAIFKWGERYLDVIDRHQCIDWLKRHEDCGAIAISRTAEQYLKDRLKNKVVWIPQQHCNFNNELRTRKEVKVVGFCGEYHTFAPFESEFRKRLADIGLDLWFYHDYHSREDVVNFYRQIDIQLVWRIEPGYIAELKNPLKLSNAGSFGIPTVAQPEPNFVAEWDEYFIPAKNIKDAVNKIEILKNDSTLYSAYSQRALAKAQKYHISEVAKLYRELQE